MNSLHTILEALEQDCVSPHRLESLGWTRMEAEGFIDHVGPFWTHTGHTNLMGVIADERHRNRRGVVQGGLIATLADRAMGRAGRLSNKERPQATISLSIDYLASGNVGDFLTAISRVSRITRHIVFVDCDLYAAHQMIANAKATFKVLARDI